jgi:uncharacterized membrane protein YcgQ (UPF0703/DUF1980 family)
MGIRNWFGKSLVNLLKDVQRQEDAQIRQATDMERMFGSATPAIIAFRIENGFVVRTVDVDSAIVGSRQRGFTYCKDHQEIAQHILASEAKRKLNIGEEYQQEMFAAEKAHAIATQRNVVGASYGRSI